MEIKLCKISSTDVSRDDTGILVRMIADADKVNLQFVDEKTAENMAFAILHRLGHRFNDGKHTQPPQPSALPPDSGEPRYKLMRGTGNQEGMVGLGFPYVVDGLGLCFEGDSARDLAWALNKARAERLRSEMTPRQRQLRGED